MRAAPSLLQSTIRPALILSLVASTSLMIFSGCATRRPQVRFSGADTGCPPCQDQLQRIEYPQLACPEDTDGMDLLTAKPITLSDFESVEPLEMTIDECVEMALANSEVMQKLGGVVINGPQGATTLYDQALQETNPFQSVEAALSAYDAQLNWNVSGGDNYGVGRSVFPNGMGGVTERFIGRDSDSWLSSVGITKTNAAGGSVTLSNEINYNYNASDAPFPGIPGSFGGGYDWRNRLQFRQSLRRGLGTTVNRIAGPNATPGNYNGVLIARIRSDISLADFEAAVRNLVRDVESTYWDLYFAYRDLDTKVAARNAARAIWEESKIKLEGKVLRPDDEAQPRQQYFDFQTQAQDALAGTTGVLGVERNLRRLMGLKASDGKLIRPITQPTVAPVSYDWDQAQLDALERRVELRRQKWTIRQRELEFLASKQLNMWRLDLVGNLANGGFGSNLTGANSAASKAYDVDDWNIGIEFGGPIGNRQGHLAVRNAELSLIREKAVLKEQQRQILHDLNAAYTEVDRAHEALKSTMNSRIAVQEELIPRRNRNKEGAEGQFFLLDAQRRAAATESSVHRAIASYNKALANFEYTQGKMLQRYRIQLTEGPWSDGAQENMFRKAGRFEMRGGSALQDVRPVSLGPMDQSPAAAGMESAAAGMESAVGVE